MSETPPRRYSYREYLQLEEAALEKHEFFDGAILAMAGGTPEHSRLKSNLLGLIGFSLRGKRSRAFDSDLLLRVLPTGLATYPDLSVVCGPIERDPENPNAITNPTVLVEVLSPSTAAYDRGEKLDHYLRILTLRDVVIVDHRRAQIDVYRRTGPDTFERRGYGPGDRVPLPSIDVEIAVDEVYEGWEELREG